MGTVERMGMNEKTEERTEPSSETPKGGFDNTIYDLKGVKEPKIGGFRNRWA